MPDLDIREKVRLLPHQPGVYQFFDFSERIIYIGKAKDLRNRVGSYFNKQKYETGKTAKLVANIVDVKVFVVATEFDALLLENSLIKQHQPRYNIMLKDDKSYPWIRIRNERFPRVEGMRNPEKDGSEYFGPYASSRVMHTVVELVNKMYKLRNCNYDLSEKNIERGKYKRCLEYHIGNCKGPCEGLQPIEDYNEDIKVIRQIVKGRTRGVAQMLRQQMNVHADALDFERAEQLKQQAEQLERYQAKNTIVHADIGDVDVFSLAADAGGTCVNYLRIIDGAVINGITVELKSKLEEEPLELLQMAIAELRERFHSDAPEAIVPFDPEIEMPGITFTVPQRGDKKSLLDLSERNARYFLLDKRKQEKLVDPEAATNRILEQLKQDLRLSELPVHIECFDNSNTQGTDPVSACVVFKNAKPSKKDYRHFNIRTVEGPDDFASMEEAVERRYIRLIREDEPLPQLIVIDGGKGQLSAAMNALERLGLRGKIAIIGIAKKLEEIYFPGDPYPLHIDKRSISLRVIQHMRNEAHRFGITHHRGKRSKRVIKTGLEAIAGVGPGTAQKLLTRFGSIKGVKEAMPEDVIAEIGKKKAEVVLKGLMTG
ncbi:MAG: excinuclease ABC subunit C [Flavobacteriales bacterium]|nr:excinuclease ABC subunit C [Flavobacteriales bacterium]MBK6944233.1 excinuclease ABC subunit C [Flavobacteriales bacterium]MBK7240433.1 excinuclease ABC subunit C [Flavobacteriales bacterium]MBK9533899.1 excinuclease ABC subunit C [Flavobacteriales bacterium]MBP9139017.1 excinuclease ABC subunit C [Flavobacteriales bacterium]